MMDISSDIGFFSSSADIDNIEYWILNRLIE